jgi:hypothetical protein
MRAKRIETAIGVASPSEKEKIMSTKKQPTHRVYSVTKDEEKPFWLEIGAAWPHKDGNGFNIKLNACPIGNGEIVLRTAKPKEAGA